MLSTQWSLYKLKVGNAMKKLSILFLAAALLLSGCANTTQSSYKYNSTERYTVKLSVGDKEIAKENEAALNVSINDMPSETSGESNTQAPANTSAAKDYHKYSVNGKTYGFSGDKLVSYENSRWDYDNNNKDKLKADEIRSIANDIAKNYLPDFENYTVDIDDSSLTICNYYVCTYNRKFNKIRLNDNLSVFIFEDGIIANIFANNAGAFYGVDVPEFDKEEYINTAKAEYIKSYEDCFELDNEWIENIDGSIYYCIYFKTSMNSPLYNKKYKICDVK